MPLPAQPFLDGAWRNSASDRRTTLINPATEEPFGEVAAADVADVNAAVESAQRVWESGWRDVAPGKREAILHAVARKLREHLEEIAQLETLHIGKPIGDALVTHPLVRKVSFTGSTGIGRRIMELASRDLKRISLELGGKSPNIVFADADWQRAAETSPMSVFANTGQDCCARSRVFVERSVCEPFVDRFVAATKKLVVGDPTQPDTQLGPLVSAGQRATVEIGRASCRE